LANKAVERSMQARLEDARDAVTNKLVDILGSQSFPSSDHLSYSHQILTISSFRSCDLSL
jgi:protein transport protein SEC24